MQFDDDNSFTAHVKEIHKLNMYSYALYSHLFENIAFRACPVCGCKMILEECDSCINGEVGIYLCSSCDGSGYKYKCPECPTPPYENLSCPHCREKDEQIAELKQQLAIATDLGEHRWKALNAIYEYGKDDASNPFIMIVRITERYFRKAAEGLHVKKP